MKLVFYYNLIFFNKNNAELDKTRYEFSYRLNKIIYLIYKLY